MAQDSIGPKGQPQFSGLGAPDMAVDPGLVADYAALVGNRKVGTTAQRLALTGVEVWEELAFGDTSLGIEFTRIGGAWIPDAIQIQKNGVNSIAVGLVQVGIGKVVGSGGAFTGANITFPKPFSSPPVVVASVRGYSSAGAYSDAGLQAATGERASAQTVSASGTQIVVASSTTLSASLDYYFSWTAIGAS